MNSLILSSSLSTQDGPEEDEMNEKNTFIFVFNVLELDIITHGTQLSNNAFNEIHTDLQVSHQLTR